MLRPAVFYVLITFAFPLILLSQERTYSRVKVFANELQLKQLAQLGISLDHGIRKADVFIITELSKAEILRIKQAGVSVEILQDNLQAINKRGKIEKWPLPELMPSGSAKIPSDYEVPQDFIPGSMGGFYTYQEIMDALDSMAAKYPSLVTARAPLGDIQTYEGRDLWYVKISDNASMEESEPKVLYTSLLHAREPAGMMTVLYYMYWILENYGSDPYANYVINNTQMYFVPVMNPDGYLYNESTNPSGGGFWRKNRRDNGSSFGVDLNRNFEYLWGYDDLGSSPTTSWDTYRGPFPASEPEIQLIQDFAIQNEFEAALNYHSFGEYLIYPWGYEFGLVTPDDSVYRKLAKRMTKDNNYLFGTADQTVGYVVNGDSDDWFYGEQILKKKSYAMSPEVANTFWPAPGKIIAFCQENVWQNLVAAWFTTIYADIESMMGPYISERSGKFNFSFDMFGRQDEHITVFLNPMSDNIRSVGNELHFTNTAKSSSGTGGISYVLDDLIECGEEVFFQLGMEIRGEVFTKDVSLIYADAERIEVLELGREYWEEDFFGSSGNLLSANTGILSDSPYGRYQDLQDAIIQTKVIDLSQVESAKLSYEARWEIEAIFDYAQLEISTNGGEHWNVICTGHSSQAGEFQKGASCIYQGFQQTWISETIDLDNYIGQEVLIRFRLRSDDQVNFDGLEIKGMQLQKLINPDYSTQSPTLIVGQNQPNPASSYTVIDYQAPYPDQGVMLRIYNLLGQMQYSAEVFGGQYILNTGEWPSGTYLYQIEQSGISSKLMKMQLIH